MMAKMYSIDTRDMMAKMYPIDTRDEIDGKTHIDHEDFDLLRDAVLELIYSVGVERTNLPDVRIIIGPACDKLLKQREEGP